MKAVYSSAHSAPAMTAPAIAAGMASPASLLGVLFHHGSERLDSRRQTEPVKADRNGVPSFAHSPIPVGGEAINVVLTFFMALLSFRGISTPSLLPAQGEQRRSSYFNIPRGNSMMHWRGGLASPNCGDGTGFLAPNRFAGEQVYVTNWWVTMQIPETGGNLGRGLSRRSFIRGSGYGPRRSRPQRSAWSGMKARCHGRRKTAQKNKN